MQEIQLDGKFTCIESVITASELRNECLGLTKLKFLYTGEAEARWGTLL